MKLVGKQFMNQFIMNCNGLLKQIIRVMAELSLDCYPEAIYLQLQV